MLPSSAAASSGVREDEFCGSVSFADNLTSLSRLYRYHFTAEESLKPTQTVSHSLKSLTSFAEKKKNSPIQRAKRPKVFEDSKETFFKKFL